MDLLKDKLKEKKVGFTLIEVMLLLVVVSLIFASSTSVITRKHKLKPRRSVHGQYLCYRNRDDGNLHEVMYSGKSVLLDRNQTTDPTFTQCSFDPPNSAPYLYVMVIGGGGAGGNANHSPDYERKVPATFSIMNLLRNPNAEKSTDNGVTQDYIHSYKWNNVEFSVKAFQQIMNDAGVKLFAYDYAGSGGPGGDYRYFGLSASEAEVEPSEGEGAWHWYRSNCKYIEGTSGTEKLPEECIALAFTNNSNIEVASGLKVPITSDAAREYCQYRYPLYKNCPILIDILEPIPEYRSCGGIGGGQGGLLVSPVVDFRLKTYYQLGKRYRPGGSESYFSNDTIDWNYREYDEDGNFLFTTEDYGKGRSCTGGINWVINYGASPKGTLLTTQKSCGDANPNENCKDINTGRTIKEPSNTYINGTPYISSEYDYKYFQDSKEVCVPKEGAEPDADGNIPQDCHIEYFTNLGDTYITNKHVIVGSQTPQIYKSLYFDVYPKVTLTINAAPCLNAVGGMEGTADGREPGLPYFVDNELTWNKVGEGIKLCVKGVCTIYSTTNHDIIHGDIMATSGGLGSSTPEMNFDLTTGLPLAEHPICNNPRPPVHGDTTMHFPAKYGTYHYCSGNMGIFTNKQYTFLTDINSNSATNLAYYNCPAVTYHAPGKHKVIGLKFLHVNQVGRLYYGERGRAGEYRALFARSFSESGIKMEPGRGGLAKPIAVNSTASAGTGGISKLGTSCVDDNIDNCLSRFYSYGGIGGRSHLKGTIQDGVVFTSQQIQEYVDDPTKAPEPKYSENYTATDPYYSYKGEDSEFQQTSFLTDLAQMVANPEDLLLIGKGGDGGYVKHNCWLMPQYFAYSKVGYSNGKNDSDLEIVKNILKDETPVGLEDETFDEWEGYTDFSEAVINNIDVCKAGGKTFKYQFEETPGTNGYSGAIVIMW